MPIKTALLAFVAVAGIAALAAGCTSPPKPPTVDDSSKRPLNSPHMIELQRCTGELSATRIALNEAMQRALTAVATAAGQSMAAAQRANDAASSCRKSNSAADKLGANRVFVVPFKIGSAAMQLMPQEAERLARAIAGAQLVIVRGRTDALVETLAESALARRRARAAGDFLVLHAGLPKTQLRLQWQGAIDDSSGAANVAGQQLPDRRVEIEIYATAPQREPLANLAL